MKLYLLFCIYYPILLYDVIDYMICLVNNDDFLTSDDVDIEEL